MLTVPEVDDDINASSSSAENAQPTTEAEVTVEPQPSPLPPPLTSTSASATEKDDQTSTESQPPPPTSREHISRFSQFQRNTIHVCDQISDHVTPHQQQHHSAPPSHNQPSKSGLDAIHENGEYPSNNEQQNPVNIRFPRSSTVPYPAYATVRTSGGYYYSPSDNTTFIHGTVSPAQLNAYYSTRQPFALVNTNFQPISPHHHLYGSRPVDILKPTFLIVPKAAEQRLAAQLSASNSPVPINKSKSSPTKSITKKSDIKSPQKSVTTAEQSPSITRHVEIQANNQSPTITTMDTRMKHIGLIATANPSPYVHFVNVTYPKQTSQEGLPETTVVHDEFQNLNDYNQPTTTSIQSMPNISLAQVSPQHLYGSPTFRYYSISQQPADEQQILTSTETNTVRAATAPHMGQTTTGRVHIETGETDESSVASLDFAQTDFVDMPGSWRYQSIPIRAIPRRYRAPIPQSFLDQQHYLSDSEQVAHSSSYKQQPQQQLSGSIPTINRPFDSIRSQQPIQFPPLIRLTEKDLLKIAAFYKSMGTLVYVARSLATLYTSDFDAMANLKDWKKLYTGVPIWLFNTGMNPKRARCIRLIISELGSSFTLWDTIVNGASDVRLPKARHITLKSLETGTILALKFDDVTATDEFHQYFVKLSCDPRNTDLFDVFNAKRRRPVFILRKKKIKKSAISKPSHFNHITKVDEHDRDSLYTFSVLVDDGAFVS